LANQSSEQLHVARFCFFFSPQFNDREDDVLV
jgi:hypothetical protein